MEESLKRRLVGGAVLVSLVVIFAPMLLDEPEPLDQVFEETGIPEKPEIFHKPLIPNSKLPEPISQEPAPEKVVVEAKKEPVTQESRTGKISRPSPTAWLIQIGSFSKKENALQLRAKLKKAGITASLKEVTVNGKRHYRVQMYPRLDKREAQKLLGKIQNEFVASAKMLPYRGE